MVGGDTLYVFRTKYGNFLPITCVDLISDDVQYLARAQANRSQIDVLVNITYNPASWEFMREANALVKRHPVFVNLTNVSNPGKKIPDNSDFPDCPDTGGLYGNSSLFASLDRDLRKKIIAPIPSCFKTPKGNLHPAYDSLIRQIDPDKEGILSYELNLRLVRQPKTTNAPDQGYPTLRNLSVSTFEEQ